MDEIDEIITGDQKKLKDFINNGGNINEKNKDGLSLLLYYAKKGDLAKLDLSIMLGSNLLEYDNKSNSSALMLASYHGHYLCCERLIDFNASIDQQDVRGKSSIMHALERTNKEVIELLVTRGANMLLQDNEGRNAYHYALVFLTEEERELLGISEELCQEAMELYQAFNQTEEERRVEAIDSVESIDQDEITIEEITEQYHNMNNIYDDSTVSDSTQFDENPIDIGLNNVEDDSLIHTSFIIEESDILNMPLPIPLDSKNSSLVEDDTPVLLNTKIEEIEEIILPKQEMIQTVTMIETEILIETPNVSQDQNKNQNAENSLYDEISLENVSTNRQINRKHDTRKNENYGNSERSPKAKESRISSIKGRIKEKGPLEKTQNQEQAQENQNSKTSRTEARGLSSPSQNSSKGEINKSIQAAGIEKEKNQKNNNIGKDGLNSPKEFKKENNNIGSNEVSCEKNSQQVLHDKNSSSNISSFREDPKRGISGIQQSTEVQKGPIAGRTSSEQVGPKNSENKQNRDFQKEEKISGTLQGHNVHSLDSNLSDWQNSIQDSGINVNSGQLKSGLGQDVSNKSINNNLSLQDNGLTDKISGAKGYFKNTKDPEKSSMKDFVGSVKNNQNSISSKNLNINQKNKVGQTQLMQFIDRSNIEKIQEQITLGADVTIKDFKGETALTLAIRRGLVDIVKILVEAGAKVDMRNGEGIFPVHLCAQLDQDEILKYLLANKASKDISFKGMDLLMYACSYGSINVVKTLLVLGFSPKAKDYKGRGAIYYAKTGNHQNVVNLLSKLSDNLGE